MREATVHPKATEHIPEIIALIETLLEKGLAYETGGDAADRDVYYRTERFADYGKLSHQPLEELRAGARVDVNEVKESPMVSRCGKRPSRESRAGTPLGARRPGCTSSARPWPASTLAKPSTSTAAAGPHLPHHENEIAQSEGASGVPFVRYWLHNGFLSIDNKKMSKSLGNFFTVREAAEAYGYENIRMFMLMSHYRSPLNYSVEILLQARGALERLKTARANLQFLSENAAATAWRTPSATLSDACPDTGTGLSRPWTTTSTRPTPSPLSRAAREANVMTSPEKKPSRALAAETLKLFDELVGVLA